ncbi:MAG: hypothetical protein KKF44_07050, partial [Nanoarchaeota archaeon]|nr:hypothetical protein [Nanoarchaeota archaeon]
KFYSDGYNSVADIPSKEEKENPNIFAEQRNTIITKFKGTPDDPKFEACNPVTGEITTYDSFNDFFSDNLVSFEIQPLDVGSVCVKYDLDTADDRNNIPGTSFTVIEKASSSIINEYIYVYVYSKEQADFLNWYCEDDVPTAKTAIHHIEGLGSDYLVRYTDLYELSEREHTEYKNTLKSEADAKYFRCNDYKWFANGKKRVKVVNGLVCDPYGGPLAPLDLCGDDLISEKGYCYGTGFRTAVIKHTCNFIPPKSTITTIDPQERIKMEFYEEIPDKEGQVNYNYNVDWVCDTDSEIGRDKTNLEWFTDYGCQEGRYFRRDESQSAIAVVDEQNGLMCCPKNTPEEEKYLEPDICCEDILGWFIECMDGEPLWRRYLCSFKRDIYPLYGVTSIQNLLVEAQNKYGLKAKALYQCSDDTNSEPVPKKLSDITYSNCDEFDEYERLCGEDIGNCRAVLMVKRDTVNMVCDPFKGIDYPLSVYCLNMNDEDFLSREIYCLNGKMGHFGLKCQINPSFIPSTEFDNVVSLFWEASVAEEGFSCGGNVEFLTYDNVINALSQK